MNSEKVKEIKKDIESCTSRVECVECSLMPIMTSTNCRSELLRNCLSLINELESENERLSDELELQQMCDKSYKYNMACENGKQYKEICELKEENTKLKDRIAELEREIEENAFYSKGYAQGIKNTYEVVVPDKLKQFAERLKEKAIPNGEIVKEFYIVNIEQIDETLKEFIGE